MKLLENDEDCNVIIYVGENENEKEIQTHSCILRIRSQYFRTAFSMNKKDGKFIEIILYSVSSPCGAFLALNRTSFAPLMKYWQLVRIQFCVNKIKAIKMLKVKDKKYVYAYLKDEEGLGKAIEL
ncbi:unnamed protein product [Rhizophagus irregularis]|nr:unnamed protein product [Rhizophagus irregularis]